MELHSDPVSVGLLFDFPQRDESFSDALRLGLDAACATAGFERSVELVAEHVRGLPFGSEHAVRTGYRLLSDSPCLVVVGPSISDNALIVRDLATDAELPTINWSGGERTRGPWMFHYQVGSLEEEPIVLAERLAERGLRRPFVLFDRSPVGHGYRKHFESASARLGLAPCGTAGVSPSGDDAAAAVSAGRAAGPDALVYLGLGAASHAVALELRSWPDAPPVVANSALMFGYLRKDWRDDFAGWEYLDAVADDNPQRQAFAAVDRRLASGPTTCAGYDIGRLIGHGLANAEHLTRAGFADGLRSVKRLPATTGRAGTTMGFGTYDHAALAGDYLVLREWRDGRTVEIER